MPTWVIPQTLARSSRPGYSGERGRLVSITEVDAWLTEVRAFGIRSIMCACSRRTNSRYTVGFQPTSSLSIKTPGLQ